MTVNSQTKVEVPHVVANPRAVEVVEPIIDFVRRVIREKDVTYDEWHLAVAFLIDVCESGEMPLLLASFLEATVDEAASQGSSSSTSAIEGPYYVPGAPMLDPPCVLPQRPDEPGEALIFRGSVSSNDGQPLAGALLDVWQSDANVPGTYSNIHPGQPEFNLRGRLKTDAEGNFSLRTVKPAPYPIPDQGPTGRLLNALGRHSWRPAHIHVKVTAEGHEPLTTQLYFESGEFLDSDAVGGVKDDLILALQKVGNGQGDAELLLRYDFRLQPLIG